MEGNVASGHGRKRTVMIENKARGRSIYCGAETQDAMRERAREAGMPLSRLVIERARDDDPDRHALALSESEQETLRDEIGECAVLVRALNRGLPGCGGLNLFDALELLAREWRR